MMWTVLSLLSFFTACHAASWQITPFNTSAVLGENGTLACIVTVANGENVQWKKVVGSSVTALTLDTTILASDKSKYAVTGTYNLTVVNVQTSDEGLYQCVIGATTNQASLQAVVLPTNVSTYWETSPSIGNIVNITCRATYGKPPPYLRIYKDNIDITHLAYYYTENTRSSGYGDAVASAALTLTSLDVNKDIRCEVEYDGLYNVMNYTMNTNLNGGSSIKVHGLASVIMFMMVAIIQAM
ncbi:contactin-1-like [Mytilus californianus]|uniref:contactin-1-like n=1 Tax=Mytilus californianus TaxID=6549 RepID=UPI0022480D85|nr:contactin-1-like [Mytilus californianus]